MREFYVVAWEGCGSPTCIRPDTFSSSLEVTRGFGGCIPLQNCWKQSPFFWCYFYLIGYGLFNASKRVFVEGLRHILIHTVLVSCSPQEATTRQLIRLTSEHVSVSKPLSISVPLWCNNGANLHNFNFFQLWLDRWGWLKIQSHFKAKVGVRPPHYVFPAFPN